MAAGLMTTSPTAHLLVIDDDPAIRRVLRLNLQQAYSVEAADRVETALRCMQQRMPDLLVVDLGLPDRPGTDLIRAVRTRAATPIIVLSVRDADADKIAALDLGADDYVTKPFSVGELLARIRVALRHAGRTVDGAGGVFQAGSLRVDLERRLVTVNDREVHLSPTEYGLLATLVRYPDKVLTHRALLEATWGPQYGTEANYLHVYVARLRRKIEPDPQHPRYLCTETGVGYRLRTIGHRDGGMGSCPVANDST